MKTLKIGFMLLAFLLAAMVIVPMVSASGSVNYSSVSEVSKLPMPQLHFNSSQKYVNVTTELDPESHTQSSQITSILATSSNPSVAKIPYGSIIYHSKNGVTTVFDANGNQLFAAQDAKSAQLPTPAGSMSATRVHGVPSGSIATASGNVTYVSNKNVLLFEEIDENITSNSNISSAIPALYDAQQYVEGINATPISSSLGTYITFWTVPSNPQEYLTGEPVFLWNGVQSNGDVPGQGRMVLIQPVLQWNVESDQWSMASWVVWGDSSSYHNTDVTGVTAGDTIEGIMTYSNNAWKVTTKDTSRNLATGDLGVANMLPNSNVLLEVYLESWAPAVTRYMPGPAPFYNFIIQDTSGANCYPSTVNTDIRSTTYPQLTLGISNTTYWPNTITNPLVLTTS